MLFFSLDFTLSIDEVTGVVTIAQPLDRERLTEFTTVIVATDQGPGFNRDNVSKSISLVMETVEQIHLVRNVNDKINIIQKASILDKFN